MFPRDSFTPAKEDFEVVTLPEEKPCAKTPESIHGSLFREYLNRRDPDSANASQIVATRLLRLSDTPQKFCSNSDCQV